MIYIIITVNSWYNEP